MALSPVALWSATHADVRARSSAASNFASQEGDLDAPRMRSIGAVMNEKSAITTWNSVVRAMTSRFSNHHSINGVDDSTFTTHIQQEVERATSNGNRAMTLCCMRRTSEGGNVLHTVQNVTPRTGAPSDEAHAEI